MSAASILANNESNAPDATSSSTASRPLTRSDRALSSATRSILILSDGPAAYTKDLTPPVVEPCVSQLLANRDREILDRGLDRLWMPATLDTGSVGHRS